MSSGVRRLVIALALSALGCDGGGGSTVNQVQVTGPSTFYALGETEAFTATATLSNGVQLNVTNSATWTSSDASIVTVVSSQATAVAAGTTEIKATFSGRSGSSLVQVTPATWTFLGAPTLTQIDPGVEFLAVDPRDESTIYVGTPLGLYVTRNGGGSWAQPLSGFIKAVALDPRNADRVYAIVNAVDLMRSDDRGATFVTLKTFEDFIDSLRLSTKSPGTLYVGFGGFQNSNPSGTFKSTDAGATWTRQPFGVGGFLIVWDVAEDEANGTLYAGTEIADHPQPYHPPFFRSTDGGQTWVDVTGILPWHVIHIDVNSATHTVLALTEGVGLYKTTDEAQTWTRLSVPFADSLLVDPGDATRIFGGDIVFGVRNGGAYISHDSAAHFQPFGLSGLSVADLKLNGSRTRLYAACYNSGIYVTSLGP